MNAYDVVDLCALAMSTIMVHALMRAGAAEEREDFGRAFAWLLVAGFALYGAGKVADTNYRPGCVRSCRLDHDRLTTERAP